MQKYKLSADASTVFGVNEKLFSQHEINFFFIIIGDNGRKL
jgi:hypothetical protein